MVVALSAPVASANGAVGDRAISSAARQFLSDSAPANAASLRFETAALGWLDNPTITNRQAAAAAKPLVEALERMHTAMSHQRWPIADRKDLRSLAAAFKGLVDDLDALGHANLRHVSSWEAPLLRDQARTLFAANRLRRDLGLKPLSGV